MAAVVLVLVGAVLATVLLRGAGGSEGRVVADCSYDKGDAGRIQDVIDGSETGDEVVLDGPCLVDTTIVLRGGRGYRGESAATVLRAAPGSNLPAVLASDAWVGNTARTGDPITLRDLTVDAARDDNPRAKDAVVVRSWRSQLENLHVYDARATCLRLTSRSADGTDVEGTQVADTIRGVFVQGCGGNGIYVEDKVNAVTDGFLADSIVGDTGGDGIAMENAGGWTVRANHVYNASRSAIDVFRLFATTIADNYVEGFGTGSGIKAYLQSEAGNVIVGNKIFQVESRQGGILLDLIGNRQGVSIATVTGNVIRGNGSGTALSYRTEGASLAVTSQGNSVSGVQTPIAGEAPNAGY